MLSIIIVGVIVVAVVTTIKARCVTVICQHIIKVVHYTWNKM